MIKIVYSGLIKPGFTVAMPSDPEPLVFVVKLLLNGAKTACKCSAVGLMPELTNVMLHHMNWTEYQIWELSVSV